MCSKCKNAKQEITLVLSLAFNCTVFMLPSNKIQDDPSDWGQGITSLGWDPQSWELRMQLCHQLTRSLTFLVCGCWGSARRGWGHTRVRRVTWKQRCFAEPQPGLSRTVPAGWVCTAALCLEHPGDFGPPPSPGPGSMTCSFS